MSDGGRDGDCLFRRMIGGRLKELKQLYDDWLDPMAK